MDDFALGYLLHRFFYQIFDFFRHWYVGGSRVIAHAFVSTLETVDKSFAVEITVRHFFEPLYKDYSIIGRVLGVIFRSARVAVGAVIFIAVAVGFAIAAIVWVLIPPALLFFSVKGL